MTRESLVTQDWEGVVARLGGASTLEQSAHDTKGFLRARAIASAVDLLRLILAYCLSDRGLRSTAASATAMGLADISNVARAGERILRTTSARVLLEIASCPPLD